MVTPETGSVLRTNRCFIQPTLRQELNVELREIKSADNQAIERIIRQVLEEFDATGPGTTYQDADLSTMFQTYQQSRSTYFVAVLDNALIGGTGIAPLSGGQAGICELQRMYLAPASRGYGVGRLLLRRSLEAALQFGYEKCYLETLPEMEKARRMYQAARFQPLDARQGDTGHSQCHCWYLLDPISLPDLP